MVETYSFTDHIDKFKDGGLLQPVVEQILKETIDCSFFIQEYARRNFLSTYRESEWEPQTDPQMNSEGRYASFLRRRRSDRKILQGLQGSSR